jgi:hypothetical protein
MLGMVGTVWRNPPRLVSVSRFMLLRVARGYGQAFRR